ncbi:MAG: DUF3090 family protein [Actinomycetes bacterium]|jgi:uncharacterized repeat protein (TIGR03847 family)
MRKIFAHPNPDRFVSGTVGQPGERIFFLQAKSKNSINSVVVEKSQVAILAERIDILLDQIKTDSNDESIPTKFDQNILDLEPLENPINEEFRTGVLSLGWNIKNKNLIIEAHAESTEKVPEIDSNETTGPDVLRVYLSAIQGRNFSERARRLVSAGRQPCPFCQEPLGQQGHICARANGYKR